MVPRGRIELPTPAFSGQGSLMGLSPDYGRRTRGGVGDWLRLLTIPFWGHRDWVRYVEVRGLAGIGARPSRIYFLECPSTRRHAYGIVEKFL